jgi:polyisoprenoid-binding protein YceI
MNAATFLGVSLFIVCAPLARAKGPELVKDRSWVTYRLVHPLHEIEATSKDVVYAIDAVEKTKEIRHVEAEVDVMTFDSGNSNRDSHAMEVIDALDYPDVSFSSTAIRTQGDSIDVDGMLQFHGVTRQVEMLGTASWQNDTLVVHGGFNLSLTAFHIERPSLLMIPVEDTLHFAVNATFNLK